MIWKGIFRFILYQIFVLYGFDLCQCYRFHRFTQFSSQIQYNGIRSIVCEMNFMALFLLRLINTIRCLIGKYVWVNFVLLKQFLFAFTLLHMVCCFGLWIEMKCNHWDCLVNCVRSINNIFFTKLNNKM